jgi:hypothetical protein
MALKQYIRDSIKKYLSIMKSELSGKSDTSHNHNLNDLAEKDYDSLDNKPDLSDLHNHPNKTVLDKFGEDADGKPTYNGNAVDTVIPQRDVYDGLDSDDNTISLSAKQGKVLNNKIEDHKNDTNNPHNVTKAQVGLDQVDNTSDADKPISTAVQQALDGKADTNHNHDGVYIPVGGDPAMNVDFATITLPNDGYLYVNTSNDERSMLRDNCLKLMSKASDVDNKVSFWVNAWDNAQAIEILGKDNNNNTVTNVLKVAVDGHVGIRYKSSGSAFNEIPVISANGFLKHQDETLFIPKRVFAIFRYWGYKHEDLYIGASNREQTAELAYHAPMPIDSDDFDNLEIQHSTEAQGLSISQRDDAKAKDDDNYKVHTTIIQTKGKYLISVRLDMYRWKMYTDDWMNFGFTTRITENSGSISHGVKSMQVLATNYKTSNNKDYKGMFSYAGSKSFVLDVGTELSPAIQSFDSGFLVHGEFKIELLEVVT